MRSPEVIGANAAARRSCAFENVERVVAVGDLHGNYAGFCAILRHCGLVDDRIRWKARRTHLVQLGDIVGRGGEPARILALLCRLETEAREHESMVHVLLGNHETMSLCGFHAYRTPEEIRDFASVLEGAAFEKGALRDDGWDILECLPSGRASRPEELPSDLRFQLSPRGSVGGWMARLNSAVKVNGVLFVHGGLTRDFGFEPLAVLNNHITLELLLGDSLFNPRACHLGRKGPQWSRDYTLRPSPLMREELEDVLRFHRCSAMVVGHTPTFHIDRGRAGRIVSLYDDRLYCIDTGIGKAYGGYLSALTMEGGSFRCEYPGP